MKKLLPIIIIVLIAAAGYVVYTLQSGGELDELSPLANIPPVEEMIKDNLDSMDESTMDDLMEQTKAMQDTVMEKAEPMPTKTSLIAQGAFMKRLHGVSGQALLIDQGDKKILRFENFETDNGPNLHIYLASELGADDFIDLGKIRATKGNVNYEVDASIDTEKYNKVLVWCVPFGVLFSYAELN